jgi:type I restriction enzyme S subunit
MELKPGYTQTEVGLIPEVWTVVSLGSTARGIYRGASPRPIENPIWFDDTSKVGWVRISDVTRSGRQLVETTQRLSKEGIQKSRFIPSGSLIMSICATVGRPIETQIDVCIHDGFVVFDRPLIDQGYLYHVLKDLEPRWSSKGQTGSQMNLNGDLIKSTLIPLPPTKAEQESIAEALSDADALIESLDQLIAKKRQIKQGAMQELLTCKRRLPGFSGEWEVKRLGDFGSTYGGLTGKTKADFGEGSSRYITFMNVMANVVIDCDIFEPVNVSSTESQNRAAKGDLFFNGSSETPEEVGLCSVLANSVADVYLNSFCFGFRFRDGAKANGLYFAYFFRSIEGRELLKSLAQGATRYNLSKTALLKVAFPLPSLEEQTAIATVLSDMDTELAALESRLAKARQIKQGMMQELLTGRIRLL